MHFRGFPQVFHQLAGQTTIDCVDPPMIFGLVHTYSRVEIILTRLLFAVGSAQTNLSQLALVLVVPIGAVVS
jgi:hypothetical protein